MAFTFGAATTDRISATLGTGFILSQRAALWCGWFYPTALTATRCLWGNGAVAAGGTRCAISATSGEIDITLDRATTDYVVTTSGLGLVTGRWQFIAVAIANFDTGAVTTTKVWKGTEFEIPQAIALATPSAAGTGNVVTASQMVIGNGSTAASLAFVGDIGNQFVCVSSSSGSLNGATNGSIGTVAEDIIYNQLVIPFWRGEAIPSGWFNTQNTQNTGIDIWSVNMDVPSPFFIGLNNSSLPLAGSVSGATQTQSNSPVAMVGNLQNAFVLPMPRR